MPRMEFPPSPGQIYGRDAILTQIDTLLEAPTGPARALFLVGDGGTGKTRLLEAIVARLQQLQHPFLPIYDFYHIDKFNASAIERAIMEALLAANPSMNEVFKDYREVRQQLENARQSGTAFEVIQQKLRSTFLTCYNAFARQQRSQGHAIVLLFDTVEQSVNLTDKAETLLVETAHTASDGGEVWLREMLPPMQHTLVILSGRHRTLHNQEVGLYRAIMDSMPHERIEITGIPLEAIAQLAAETQAYLTEEHQPEDIRQFASDVDLSDQTLTLWYAISDGLPFWISMLFTCEMLGEIPPAVDALRERIWQGEHLALSAEEQAAVRTAVMQHILRDIDMNTQPLIIALQWMATMRKGVTPAILQAVASAEGVDIGDASNTWEHLRRLLIVKQRCLPRYTQPGPEQEETLLFLHDEMYHWLDHNFGSSQTLRASVSAALTAWYDTAIQATEEARLQAVERLLLLDPEHPDVGTHTEERDQALRQKQQLVLDRLGYAYQQEYMQGVREYGLLAYATILKRLSGYGIVLRQEALRNAYRFQKAVFFAEEVECAARWVLRATHADDAERAMTMIEKLSHYYAQEAQNPGLHFALLYLAEAQARLYFSRAVDSVRILYLLKCAEQLTQAYETEDHAAHNQIAHTWCDFLKFEIARAKGYYYRLEYQLYDAIETYRTSLILARHNPQFLPEFQGATLNNLAFVYSEQGEIADARRFGQRGLEMNQRFGSSFNVGLSYNTLARIEIRAGRPDLAVQYAQLAHVIFTDLKSVRGLSLCLPVLAEAYRKQAEWLDTSVSLQTQTFEKAIARFQEALELLETEKITSAERRREVYQGLGCAYRSRAYALIRRNANAPEAKQDFSTAHNWLEKALEVSENAQPPLILLDIHEDLAVVHVNEEEFDERIYKHLTDAESKAPQEYKIQPGIGLRDIPRPVRGYWRELGQCQMQRMLSGFGKYDMGYFTYNEGTRRRIQDPLDECCLQEAAQHLLLAVVYLLKYARFSTTLDKVTELALREMRRERTEQQLKLILQEVYKTARQYKLLESEALAFTAELILRAQRDLDLPA